MDKMLDSVCGIEASLEHLGGADVKGSDFNFYLPVTWYGILRALYSLPITERDVFLDVGCGKGRALGAALLRPFKKIIGLEISEPLLRSAEKNISRSWLRKWNPKSELLFVCEDATTYQIDPQVSVLLMACPFGEESTRLFLRHLKAASYPGQIRYLIAVNPLHMSFLADHFATEVLREWGRGWYRIYKIVA